MARAAKRARALVTFNHPVKITVRRPEFELLASVKQLDIGKLARAAHAEIELGYVRTDCCRQFVRAVIRRGMVTRLVVEPCSDGKSVKVSPELARLLKAASRRVAGRPGKRPPKFPMPVATFMSSARFISVDTITCVQICIFGFCIQCCELLGSPGEWACGRVIVDTISLPVATR
jgi:hypothetical protein